MKKAISLIEIKNALNDERFRDSLPDTMKDDLAKYLEKKGCGQCGLPFIRKILENCQSQLQAYFPDLDIEAGKKADEDARQAIETARQQVTAGQQPNLPPGYQFQMPQQQPNQLQHINKLMQNHWNVFNCHIDELEKKLKDLPQGRKQIAITRYEDQVTLIVNELDLVY